MIDRNAIIDDLIVEGQHFEISSPRSKPYGFPLGVYKLRYWEGKAWELNHIKMGSFYATNREELVEMLDDGILLAVIIDPEIARKQAQIVAIRAASPMRPIDGRTADVDGLALFDAVRSPCLI